MVDPRSPGVPAVQWHGVEPVHPDFSPTARALALALDGRRCDRPGIVDRDFYVAMNADDGPLAFRIPASPSGRPWCRVVDTALPSPADVVDVDEGPCVQVMSTYVLPPRSMIILASLA